MLPLKSVGKIKAKIVQREAPPPPQSLVFHMITYWGELFAPGVGQLKGFICLCNSLGSRKGN